MREGARRNAGPTARARESCPVGNRCDYSHRVRSRRDCNHCKWGDEDGSEALSPVPLLPCPPLQPWGACDAVPSLLPSFHAFYRGSL